MSTPKLVIPIPTAELPTCSPNLMPFHINYTGPAAVSAFMRVEKLQLEKLGEEKAEHTPVLAPANGAGDVDMSFEDAKEPSMADASTDVDMQESTPATPSTAGESQSLSASASEATLVVESQASTSTSASAPAPAAQTPPPPAPVLEDADRRFVSTFRGRTIHGLTIDLPEGYGGLLLKSDAKDKRASGKEVQKDAKGKQPASSSSSMGKAKPSAKSSGKNKAKAAEKEEAPTKPRGRLTRSAAVSSKRTEPIVVEDEDDEMVDEAPTTTDVDDEAAAASETPDDHLVRQLVPTAQFSTFTLWHADRPVDKGRDEYTRMLTEWVSLAHEIHRTDL